MSRIPSSILSLKKRLPNEFEVKILESTMGRILSICGMPSKYLSYYFPIENWYQEWGCYVTKSDNVVLRPLELICERNLEDLGAVG